MLGKGAIAGLFILTAIFMGAVAAAYWSHSQPLPRLRVTTEVAASQPSEPIYTAPAAQAEVTSVREAPSVKAGTAQFDRCGLVRITCVVDGDTIWLEGEKIRVADIDTPEISKPQCASEKALGDRATERLVVLLNEGPFEIATIGSQDEDRFGRKLRILVRGGKSLGDQLVAEGLARTWTGRREPWC